MSLILQITWVGKPKEKIGISVEFEWLMVRLRNVQTKTYISCSRKNKSKKLNKQEVQSV